jgi:dTMP kinase
MERLQKHNHPGLLIAFEGIDGCGKGTQIDMLADRFKGEGWGDRVVMNKQPGATKLGLAIREILFHTVTTHNMEPDAASLLFLASHVQSLCDVVIPALKAGKVVISDRWCAYSDVAFGLHGLERPISQALVDARSALGGPEPDLLFFMYGDPATLLTRAFGRAGESHESGKRWANVETLSRIQQTYHSLFEPMHWDRMGTSRNVARGPLVEVCADTATPADIFNHTIWPAVFSKVRRHFDLS